MDEFTDQAMRLKDALDRHRAGDARARDVLIELSGDRMTRLCRVVLRDYPGVKRWEETDDVAQNAALRLWQSLRDVQPPTVTDLLRFTATQIRRELTDLARKFGGPEGLGKNHASVGERLHDTDVEPATETLDPRAIADWTDFHDAVDRLPDDERAVIDLLWYQGLTQPDAAKLLDISESTLRRRWRAARVKLYADLSGEPPPG